MSADKDNAITPEEARKILADVWAGRGDEFGRQVTQSEADRALMTYLKLHEENQRLNEIIQQIYDNLPKGIDGIRILNILVEAVKDKNHGSI